MSRTLKPPGPPPAPCGPDAPRILECTINFSGGGKVMIRDYGKVSSDYHVSFTRKYAIPPSWTEEEVVEFELERFLALHDQAEPILQQEFDERYAQRDW